MNRLKELREQKGFTKTKLYELTGIADSTLSALENGKRKMTPTHAKKLSKVFDCEPSYVMGTDMIRLELSFKDSLKAFLESMVGDMLDNAIYDTLDDTTRLRFLICERLINDKVKIEHLEIILSMLDGIIKKEDKQ